MPQSKIYTTKDGFTGTAKEIAEHYAINLKTVYNKLGKGISIDKIIEDKVNPKNKGTVYTTKDGFTGNIAQIAKCYNISYDSLLNRLNKKHMTIDEAIYNIKNYKQLKIYTTSDGFSGNIKEICEKYNLRYNIVKDRIRNGMTIDEAISITSDKMKQNNLDYKGETGDLRYFCKKYNKDFVEVYNKMKNLKTLEYALESTNKSYQSYEINSKNEKIYTTKDNIKGTVTQLAEWYHLDVKTLKTRLNNGMPIDKALLLPHKQHEIIHTTSDGFTGNLTQIGKKYNVSRCKLSECLNNNMTIDEAIEFCKKKVYKVYTTKDGFTGTLKNIADHLNIDYTTLRRRVLQKGMDIDQAINDITNKS